MITYEQALESVLKNTPLLSSVETILEESVGRVLSEDIDATTAMPPFDKSLMDGYALNALDARKVPAKLKCLGIIQAGESFHGKVRRGECVKIMTGAPIPKGADTVVIVENSRQMKDSVEIFEAVGPRKNISFKGEYFKRGQRVMEKGRVLSFSDISVLATLGKRFVKTIAKPRVAILNTGGEILALGAKLGKNKIYNSIGPMLEVLLKADGIEFKRLGIARDKTKELKKAIARGLKADVLLISGGVSKGDYDLVPGVLKDLGVRKIFHKVKIKPGKPLFFGIKGRTLIFGVPGNPLPNFLAYFIFVRPAVRKMMGVKACGPSFKEGILKKGFRVKAGRKKFVLAKVEERSGFFYVAPVVDHGSADTMALSRADAFMIVEGDVIDVKKGSKLKFITWKTV